MNGRFLRAFTSATSTRRTRAAPAAYHSHVVHSCVVIVTAFPLTPIISRGLRCPGKAVKQRACGVHRVSPMRTVAVLSCDEPSVILCNRLRRAGLRTSGVYVQDLRSGAIDLAEFVASEQPDLVVYDLDQPLQQSL